MKSIKAALLLSVFATSAQASEYKIDDLYGTWCLKSLAASLDGKRTPDNSSYEFTKEGRLNYKMGVFEQSGDYSISGSEIQTTAMGNYNIVSLKENDMTLKYGTYFFFEKGSCN
ncbi:hypothetical protein [Pseudomonas sp. HMWF032]|jgi:hypothetical protein|uniref:hypothetical protein n=1 Tax=Pseudomonas sp. HMWF032 TaxID=2056866 RepID=UPI0011B24DE8|nr:hypothetical protein [Pseudomonas sp. HMWF032]